MSTKPLAVIISWDITSLQKRIVAKANLLQQTSNHHILYRLFRRWKCFFCIASYSCYFVERFPFVRDFSLITGSCLIRKHFSAHWNGANFESPFYLNLVLFLCDLYISFPFLNFKNICWCWWKYSNDGFHLVNAFTWFCCTIV